MGDHFVLLVDRLLTESTLEAAIESMKPSEQLVHADNDAVMIDCSSLSDSEPGLYPRKVVECRICQDEDFDSKMETPCSCCGSLKYAHRRCVQKWCHEKGNTLCEICHQQFRPNYTTPPPLFRFGSIPMNLRGSWRISRRDLNNPRIVAAMVSTDQHVLGPANDEFADSNSRRLICFRSLVVIFMALLVLRHTLPIFATESDYYSFSLFLLLLRTLGIIVPVYIVLRAVTALYSHRQRQQVTGVSSVSSDDEDTDGSGNLESQAQSIRVP